MDYQPEATNKNEAPVSNHQQEQKRTYNQTEFSLIENSPELITQKKFQAIADNSKLQQKMKAVQEMTKLSTSGNEVPQLKAIETNYSLSKPYIIQQKGNIPQLVKDLPIDNYVEVDDGSGKVTGVIVAVTAHGYDIRIGGTDTVNNYPEEMVTVHSAVAKLREDKDAAEDPWTFQDEIYVDMNKFRRSKARMYTNGLANCIAVAAFHNETAVAAFTHYNTVDCFHMVEKDDEDYDSDDESDYKLEFNPPKLEQLKIKLLSTLGITSGVSYYVALGGMWNTQTPSTLVLKQQLIDGLRVSFNPTTLLTTGGAVAHWDPVFENITY